MSGHIDVGFSFTKLCKRHPEVRYNINLPFPSPHNSQNQRGVRHRSLHYAATLYSIACPRRPFKVYCLRSIQRFPRVCEPCPVFTFDLFHLDLARIRRWSFFAEYIFKKTSSAPFLHTTTHLQVAPVLVVVAVGCAGSAYYIGRLLNNPHTV